MSMYATVDHNDLLILPIKPCFIAEKNKQPQCTTFIIYESTYIIGMA